MTSLQQSAWQVLQCRDPDEKIRLAQQVAEQWQAGELSLTASQAVDRLPIPGRPDQPTLVSPQKMPRRSMNSQAGRNALIHAVTHIEFNAINLAWDAVYRFADMPKDFYSDWISVGLDEGRHFLML